MTFLRSCRGLVVGFWAVFASAFGASAWAAEPLAVTSLNQCYDELPLRDEVQKSTEHGGRLESILRFEPDVVLANPFSNPLLIQRLRERDVNVVTLPEPESLTQVAELQQALGDYLTKPLAPVAWPPIWQGQRVLMLQANHYSFAADTLWDDLVQALGGQNVAPGHGLVTVLPEQVLALDPDVVVMVASSDFALASRNQLHRALRPLLDERGVVLAADLMGCMGQALAPLVDALIVGAIDD